MINLFALKRCTLPQREIDVSIGGDHQKVVIHPLNGAGKIAVAELAQHLEPGNLSFSPTIIKLALMYGANLSEPDADLLIDSDPEAAIQIGNAVWLLNGEYDETRAREKELAEKNSEPVAEATTGN